MPEADVVTLFYCPHSRATGARVLLEELGAPHTLKIMNMKAGEQRQAAYLAVNPLGKVPAIWFRGQLTTEQVAIFSYLPDVFAQAKLAPAIDDPLRGPYLRWLAYYGACYEPGLVDRALKREPAPLAMSPYGNFDDMMQTLIRQLEAGPYLLGERFSAADLLWGQALNWGTLFKLVPETDAVTGYVARIMSRPLVQKVKALDDALAAEQAAAVPAP